MNHPLPPNAELRRDPASGTVRFLKGDDLSASLEDDAAFRAHRAEGRHEAIARAFLASQASTLRLQHPDEELALRSVETDELGLTHVKLGQRFHGLPVSGSELIVHLDEANRVYLLTGSYVPTPADVDTTPAFGIGRARQIAAQQVEGVSDNCRGCPCDLVILAERGEPARLAYQVRVQPNLAEGWEFMIDAHRGELLRKLPTVIHGSPSGPFTAPWRPAQLNPSLDLENQ